MLYYNKIISRVFLPIAFLILFLILSSPCFAQYIPQLYTGYLYENYSAYTRYGRLEELFIPDLFNTGLININNTLKRGTVTINGWGLVNPYPVSNGVASSIINSNDLGVIDGLGLINHYFIYPIAIYGPFGLQGNLCGLNVLGGLEALSAESGISSVSNNPAGFFNLTGTRNLAGLVSLGNPAGLKANGETGITASLDF